MSRRQSTGLQGRTSTHNTSGAVWGDLLSMSALNMQTSKQRKTALTSLVIRQYVFVAQTHALSAPVASNHKAKAVQLSIPQTRLIFLEHTRTSAARWGANQSLSNIMPQTPASCAAARSNSFSEPQCVLHLHLHHHLPDAELVRHKDGRAGNACLEWMSECRAMLCGSRLCLFGTLTKPGLYQSTRTPVRHVRHFIYLG